MRSPLLPPMRSSTMFIAVVAMLACDTATEPVPTNGSADTLDTRPFVWQSFDNLPSSYKLNGIWAVASDDVYGVGSRGLVVHWDGEKWERVQADTRQDLWGIWGASGDSLFACGDHGTVMFSNQILWRSVDTSTQDDLRAIWGVSTSSIYAVSEAARVLHFDGSGWSSPYAAFPNALLDVWASADTNVFVVGLDGWIGHLTTRGWRMTQPTYEALTSIHGTKGDVVFAAGNHGVVLRHDGSKWTQMMKTGNATLQAVWARARNDVYAAGANGTLIHYDGDEWAAEESVAREWLFALGGTSRDMFTAGSGDILHHDGTAWRPITEGTAPPLRGACAFSGKSAFVVGDGGVIFRYTGDEWFEMDSGTMRDLQAVWGRSPTDVYAVGDSRILRLVDGVWKREFELVVRFNDVIGADDGRVIAVGNRGVVRRSEGAGSWIADNNYSLEDNHAAWLTPDDGVYVVGTGGCINTKGEDSAGREVWIRGPLNRTFDGTLYDVIGLTDPRTGGCDMFAAGEEGTILHEDSLGYWSAMETNTVATLRGFGVGPRGTLYAAGDDGTLLYLDGGAWRVVAFATDADVTDVAFAPDGELFLTAGGDASAGAVLYYGREQLRSW